MPSTRADIRREAAALLDGAYLASTATGGSTSGLIDTARLQDANASDDLYVGSWVWFASGTALYGSGNVRQIASYAPASGTLAHQGALWGTVVASGMGYELHGLLDPRDWNDAINRGLRKCTRIRRDQIQTAAARTHYSLEAFDWLESAEHALRLIVRSGTVANQWVEREVPHGAWRIIEDSDAYTLYWPSAIAPGGSDVVLLESIGPYDALTTDAQRTTCPLDWAAAAAMQSAYERHFKQIDERARARIDMAAVQAKFVQQCQIWAPDNNRAIGLGGF